MTKATDSLKDTGDVEITPEMIEAGVIAYVSNWGDRPDLVATDELVTEIYRSMTVVAGCERGYAMLSVLFGRSLLEPKILSSTHTLTVSRPQQ